MSMTKGPDDSDSAEAPLEETLSLVDRITSRLTKSWRSFAQGLREIKSWKHVVVVCARMFLKGYFVTLGVMLGSSSLFEISRAIAGI